MDLFGSPAFDDHEQVVFCADRESGLRAIIGLHDLTLGPAAGGCRMWPYAREEDALVDVLRLSRGMTYKAAMAGLPYGGGKAVVIGDPRTGKSEALFRALGRAVNGLGGRYHTAEDVGTTPADMDWVAKETPFVFGTTSGGSGDPSPMTARGVWLGIRAAVGHRLKRDGLAGVRVAVQGLGHVGYGLARLLTQDGARLLVADVDPARAARARDELGAKVVAVGDILGVDAEVVAPCALGGVINDETVPRLACAVVAGAANNQLLEDRHGLALRRRGILYAPDYVINAGGLMNIVEERHPQGYDIGRVMERLQGIPRTLRRIFDLADEESRPTNEIADYLARQRLGRDDHVIAEPPRVRAAS